jgi:hypothetical protein
MGAIYGLRRKIYDFPATVSITGSQTHSLAGQTHLNLAQKVHEEAH